MSLFDFFRRPPTPHKYAQLLMKKLAIHHPDEPVRFDEAGFRLLVGSDGSQVINLHNLYPEYCAADKHERVLQLERAIAIMRPPGLPATFAEARTHLMPVLRGRGMMEYLRLMELGKEPSASSGSLAFPFSSDTALMLVHDGEHMMQSFGAAQLEQWGVTADQALAAAMDTLRDASVDRFVQIEPGLFAGDWGDAYDSSRLLLADLAHRIAGANPVAMAPARGTLLLASGNNVEGVRAMVALSQRIADSEPRPVSALMYRYQDGRPVDYVPEDEVARSALENLKRQYLFGDYAAQKETLDELHEKSGTDIFVASYKVMRDETQGIEYSLCSWTNGVDSLLPRTERVALVVYEGDEMQELLMLPWDALHAACAELMVPVPDAYPERYRVTAFPDLARVRPLALPRD
ncbi:hypothetical protein [Massilia sp. IC2-476]|uniref:hypothetical protein n=1 Tax=Massilia sp. IC2-476 TaxID=2887199 RepID=UPI001D12C9CA|nr:hypothetical protein [Massilia sp. IC2-476]MCC2972473.1 hypothetical protein [Massilia sp. IC2-476]